MQNDCKVCGGQGFFFTKNQKGKMAKMICSCTAKTTMKDIEEVISTTISEEKLFEYIPNEFYHADIDINKFKEGKTVNQNWEVEVKKYMLFLKSFPEKLAQGVKPTKSYIVVAPPNHSKKFFIYNCIKNSLKGGLKPTHLLDTQDIYDLMNENKHREIKDMFKEHDILFLTIGNNPIATDIYALRLLMDYADRFAKPLVIISRFNTSFLLRFDSTLATELGVTDTTPRFRMNYGVLNLAGFSNKHMNDVFKEVSAEYSPYKGNRNIHKKQSNLYAEELETDILSGFSKTLGDNADELDADDIDIDKEFD